MTWHFISFHFMLTCHMSFRSSRAVFPSHTRVSVTPLFVLIGARGPLPSGGEILPTLSVTSLLRPLTLLSVILSLSNVNVFVVDEIFRGLLQGYVRVQKE